MSGTIIQGTVRSSSGDPVVEARVYFTKGPVSIPDVAALTDEEGRFSLHAPAAGTYEIECNAEGFHKRTETVEVAGNQPEVRVEIALVEQPG